MGRNKKAPKPMDAVEPPYDRQEALQLHDSDLIREVNKQLLRQIIQNAQEEGDRGERVWLQVSKKVGIREEVISRAMFMHPDEIDKIPSVEQRETIYALKELFAEDTPLYDSTEKLLMDPQLVEQGIYGSQKWQTRIETAVDRPGRYPEEWDEVAEGGMTDDGVVVDRGGEDYDGRDPDADGPIERNTWVTASYAVELRKNHKGVWVEGARLFSMSDLWEAWREGEGPKPADIGSNLKYHMRVRRPVFSRGIHKRNSDRWIDARIYVATKLFKARTKSEKDLAAWERFAKKFAPEALALESIACPLHRTVRYEKKDKRYKGGVRVIEVKPEDCNPHLDRVIVAIERKGIAREQQPIGRAVVLAEDVCGEVFKDIVKMAIEKTKHRTKAKQWARYAYDQQSSHMTTLKLVRDRQVAFVVFYDAVQMGRLHLDQQPGTDPSRLGERLWHERDVPPRPIKKTTSHGRNVLAETVRCEGGMRITRHEDGSITEEPL